MYGSETWVGGSTTAAQRPGIHNVGSDMRHAGRYGGMRYTVQRPALRGGDLDKLHPGKEALSARLPELLELVTHILHNFV